MATGIILLSMEGATAPSGGSDNAPASSLLLESSAGAGGNAPNVAQRAWAFDDTTDEHLLWCFLLPANVVGGGSVRLKFRMDSAITGGVTWKAGIASANDGVTDDSALGFSGVATATVGAPATLGQVAEALITGVSYGTAGMKHVLFIGRDADGGGDTATGDAYLLAASYEYTPS